MKIGVFIINELKKTGICERQGDGIDVNFS